MNFEMTLTVFYMLIARETLWDGRAIYEMGGRYFIIIVLWNMNNFEEQILNVWYCSTKLEWHRATEIYHSIGTPGCKEQETKKSSQKAKKDMKKQ